MVTGGKPNVLWTDKLSAILQRMTALYLLLERAISQAPSPKLACSCDRKDCIDQLRQP